MATKNFTDFLPDVLSMAAGCPKIVAINAVRTAAIRLCEDSTVWREDIIAGDLTINVDDYTITPPTDSRITVLNSVLVNDVPMGPYTEEELDRLDYGWRTAGTAMPTKYIIPEPNRFKFNRKPNQTITNGIVVRVTLKPTKVATTCGAILYEDWFECIKHGALFNLKQMKGKAWYDIEASKRSGNIFISEIQRAKARVTMGHTRKPQRVAMRPF